YYETRYEDTILKQGNANGVAGAKCSTNGWNYSEEVAYPYGYGLSYTTFDYGTPTFTPNADGSYTVKITVKNIGDKDGADAVQVYVQRPYMEHDKRYKIEQAAVNLVGFKKTGVIKAGGTEDVEIKVAADAFKTYDAFDKKTYIREAGKYYLTVAEDSHKATNNILAAKGKTKADGMDEDGNVKLVKEITFTDNDYTTFTKSSTGATITNKFDDCDWNTYENKDSTNITYLSRSDWNGTYPKKVKLTVNAKMYDDLDWNKEYAADPNDKMPKYGEQNGLTLVMLRGKEYDDPAWDDLLDETTLEEQIELMKAVYGTAAMTSIVKPGEQVSDGPLGIQCNFTATSLLAATFNEELAEKVGKLMGEYAFHSEFGGIYAPGANMHRSMYGGRGYEYYSEDTFLSSRMLAMQVRGIQSVGVYVNIKHFVLNDQDSSRKGISTWVSEQALREIYLETFRACVEEENAMGVMTGFNRVGTTWCGALSALNNGVLREEWGFKGFVISDCPWQIYMGTVDGLFGGNDCILYESIDLTQYEKAKTNATIALKLREATKHILYVVANSSSMNGYSSATKIIPITSWWWSNAIIGLIVGFAALFAISAVMLALTIILRLRYKAACSSYGVTTKEYETYYKAEIYEKPKPVKIGKLYVPRNLFISITAIVLAIVIAGLSFGTVGIVGAVKSANHKCGHVCLVCGGCKDKTCEEKSCATKCPGNHKVADITGETYTFEAEDALIVENTTSGTKKAQKGKEGIDKTSPDNTQYKSYPSGNAYIYKLSQAEAGTEVKFKIYADRKCAAGLIMRMGHTSRDVDLTSIFKIKVNGKAINPQGNIVFGTYDKETEQLYFAWRDTDIGVITLKEGVNDITFVKTQTGLNFDCIKLVSSAKLETPKECEEHTFIEYTVDKAPTETTEGTLYSYCSVCGKETTETLPAISEANGYKKTVTKEATIDETGEAEWTYTFNEKEYKFKTTIAKLPDTTPKTTYLFEAEDSEITSVNGNVTVGIADSASGGKYIDKMSAEANGASLTFRITAEKDCSVDFTVRSIKHYQDERPFDGQYSIIINGTTYKTGFVVEPNTNPDDKATIWTTFYDFKVLEGVPLKKGENTIVLARAGLALNLDAIKIDSSAKLSWSEKSSTGSSLTIEAEDCTLGGTAKIATSDSSYDVNNPSGGKFVGGLSAKVGSVTFTVTAKNACKATFILCYGNKTSDGDRKFDTKYSLTVNGTAYTSNILFNLNTDSKTHYFGWEEYVVCTVDLVEGDNTFVLTSKGVTASNIDYFKLESSDELTFKKA
ncbi:MAG TPA: hypothetical protein DDY77_03650, partial [Clostridiales bacterium]|nr:hypothetical protein [Clostridiales bacterium]